MFQSLKEFAVVINAVPIFIYRLFLNVKTAVMSRVVQIE